MRATVVGAGLLAEAGALACSSPGTDSTSFADAAETCVFCSDASIDIALPDQVKARLDLACSSSDGCHGSGVGGLGLGPGTEFAALIDVPSSERPDLLRVQPGDPLTSYVYLKLRCDGGIEGGCMPLASPPNPALAQLFFDWIEAGAPTPP